MVIVTSGKDMNPSKDQKIDLVIGENTFKNVSLNDTTLQCNGSGPTRFGCVWFQQITLYISPIASPPWQGVGAVLDCNISMCDAKNDDCMSIQEY